MVHQRPEDEQGRRLLRPRKTECAEENPPSFLPPIRREAEERERIPIIFLELYRKREERKREKEKERRDKKGKLNQDREGRKIEAISIKQ